MTKQHTPGHWSHRHHTGNNSRVIINQDLSFIGMAYELPDARLIAAAPELLEALTAVLQDWRADFMQRGCSMSEAEEMMACREGYDLARAAIAKATGEA